MHHEPEGVSRRDFLRAWVAGGTALACSGPLLWAAEAAAGGEARTDVWVFHGTDKRKLMAACLEVIQQQGGFGKNVHTLALKVNAAWARKPEEGANTHPALVDAFLAGVKEAGVPKVVVPEHPCHRAAQTFTRSGIQAAVEKHDFPMIDLKSARTWQNVDLGKARNLKQAKVATPFLEADAVVNMPVAKHHGGATLTMAMKNWMGAVQDRGFWHRNDLHQCIADFSTFMKPTWTLVDATRTMMDRGPQGPAKTLKTPNLLILSKDQVAADAFAATLFHEKPLERVKYLRLAREMKIGETELERMAVHRTNLKA